MASSRVAFILQSKKQIISPIILILFQIIIITNSYNGGPNNDDKGKHVHFEGTNNNTQQQQIKILIPDLPAQHFQFWFKSNLRALLEFKQICKQFSEKEINTIEDFQRFHLNLTIENDNYLSDLSYGKSVLKVICSKVDIASKSCWGYENNCQIIHLMPECYGSSMGQAKSEQEQKIAWFSKADFGYIMDRRKEISRFCYPDKYSNDQVKSSLECTKYFKTCRAENLMIKFKNIPTSGSLITNQPVASVVSKGNVGGWNCDLQLKRIQEENGQTGVLQSWFNELKDYNKLSGSGAEETACDVIIDKQAYVLKLDSPFNMYHYFCNFLNLYATFHLNNRFSINNQIIIWDNQLPKSNFELMWTVFSKNKPMSLKQLGEGKKVCFKKVIFALLPRMIDGLYYNTPLIPGCSKSGLFDAFNKHVLYKLKIEQEYNLENFSKTSNSLIRVTIISRATPHRQILNEEQLKLAITNLSSIDDNNYQVKLTDFSKLDLREQLTIAQNTDILIGIHGAGLTNCLFLPDWAAIIELNDCDDKCYYDLARLRGVNYYTSSEKLKLSEKQPVQEELEYEKLTKSNLQNHAKFSNYHIDISNLVTLFTKVTERVKRNRNKYFKEEDHEQLDQAGIRQPELDESTTTQIPQKHVEL